MPTTHIRIPIEVKTKLDSLAHESESIGALISRLIEYYESKGSVNNNVNNCVNSEVNTVNEALTEEIRALTSRVEALESTRFGSTTIVPEPLPMDILIESVPDAPEIVIEPCEKEERITLTKEMQKTVSDCLKALRASGMNYKEIQEKTGIPEGSQKKALSPNQSLKSLTKHQYDALMKR